MKLLFNIVNCYNQHDDLNVQKLELDLAPECHFPLEFEIKGFIKIEQYYYKLKLNRTYNNIINVIKKFIS